MSEMLIFISYKREDRDKASILKNYIENKWKILCWMDDNILAGDQWIDIIDNGLNRCTVVLVLLSSNLVKSHYVTYEWAYVAGQKKRFIPVYIEKPLKRWTKKLHVKLQETQTQDTYITNFEDLEENSGLSDLHETLLKIAEENYIPQELINAQIAASGHNELERQQALRFLEEHPLQHQTKYLLKQIIDRQTTNTIKREVARIIAQKFRDENMIDILSNFEGLSDAEIKENIVAISNIDTITAVEYLLDIREKSDEYQIIVDTSWKNMKCEHSLEALINIANGNYRFLGIDIYTALANHQDERSQEILNNMFGLLLDTTQQTTPPYVNEHEKTLFLPLVNCLRKIGADKYKRNIMLLLEQEIRTNNILTEYMKCLTHYISDLGTLSDITSIENTFNATSYKIESIGRMISRAKKAIIEREKTIR